MTRLWRRKPPEPFTGAPAHGPAPKPRNPSVPAKIGTTLDHSWDRRLRVGGVAPDRVADLHGLRVDAAHRRAVETIEAAARNGDRLVLLITGRAPPTNASRLDQPLRGIIRASIR